METNELRRTRIKLALFEIEGVNWLLSDILGVMGEEGEGPWSQEGNIWLIEKLKKNYKEKIKELSPKDKTQQELFKYKHPKRVIPSQTLLKL